MTAPVSFAVVGGDKRMICLVDILRQNGYKVCSSGLCIDSDLPYRKALADADCIILPVPAERNIGFITSSAADIVLPTKDVVSRIRSGSLICAGMVSENLLSLADSRNIDVEDYYTCEDMASFNADITAECILQATLDEIDFSLHLSRALIIGYGRVGSRTAALIRAIGTDVHIFDSNESALNSAHEAAYQVVTQDELPFVLPSFEVIINTAPMLVLNRDLLSCIREDAQIIDVASPPGGTDFVAAQDLGRKCIHALSLPGRLAPRTSGRLVYDSVMRILRQRNML